MNRTPMGALLHQAEIRPNSTAFMFGEDKWTYERLAAESKRLAQGLSARGIGSGDRIALHMKNRPEMIVAYFACFQLGAIAAPLRTAFTPTELGLSLQRLKPALYIGEMVLYDNIAPIDVSILASEKRFVVGAAAEASGVQPWERLFDGSAREYREITPALHEPAVLINTSGTTGQPKFVIHTPSTLFEAAYSLGENWEVTDDDILPHHLALAHAGGLVISLCFIRVGAPFILFESFDADAALDVIERDRCTLCGGFPAQYAALLDRQLTRPRDLSSLRMCLTFGDVCPPDLQAQFSKAFGAPLYNLWGSTEALGSLTHGLQFGPVARIAKRTQIRLIDDDGKDVPHGEIGELLIRGSNIFAGYWDDPEATADGLKDGWYHTGDLMCRGDGDDIWFTTRKKDLIIRGGTNISPVEIEEALIASHPAVELAAAVGVPDKLLGQRVFGFVKLATGVKNTIIPDILRETSKRLADYKVPEDLAVLAEMPRNALSKLDRNALTALASERWQSRSRGSYGRG
jgi:long-chain acyl-CoA synthetase